MRNTNTSLKPPQKREHIFSVRLTSNEHKAIMQLAQKKGISSSHVVRHFLCRLSSKTSPTKGGSNMNQFQNENGRMEHGNQVNNSSKEFDLAIAYRLLIGAYIRSRLPASEASIEQNKSSKS